MAKIKILNKNVITLVFILIFAAFLRLFFLVKSDNYLGIIPIVNITNSSNLSFKISSLINNWHLASDLLIRLSLFVYNNSSVSPRILMVLLATFSIIPFYKLNRLFFNSRVSLTSAVLLSIYPLHLKLSSVTITQIPFIFFSLWALYYFFKFTKVTNNIKDLMFSCIFLNIITIIRFEAILFIVTLFLFLLFAKYRKCTILFIIISLLFFFFNFSLSIKYNKRFLEYLISSSEYSRAEMNFAFRQDSEKDSLIFPRTLTRKIISWPAMLYFSLGPFITIFTGLGLLISFIKKNYLELFFLGFFILLCFFFKTFRNTLSVQEHYSLIFGVLFISYAAFGIDTLFNFLINLDLVKRFNLLKITFNNILYPCLILVIIISGINIAYKNKPILPEFVRDVANWLERNVESRDTYLIIDMDRWQLYYEHIIFLSGLNRKNFLIEPFKIINNQRHVDMEKVLNYLNTKQPKYLVFSPGGLLSEIFPFKREREFNTAYGFIFKKEYEEGEYIIYSIKKSDEIS